MPLDEKAREVIRKYAVKNAADYGKASLGSVLGKALSKIPGAKGMLGEVRREVERQVDEVNMLTQRELEKEYDRYRGEFEEEREERAGATAAPRMVLEGAQEGNFVSRFPPEPGGYVQIGNMKQAFLSYEFAKIYKGKFYLYFDDTNAEKCRQEFVDGIKRDMEWLGLRYDKEYYASDYIEKVYDCARQLIRDGKAYVCGCSEEKIKDYRFRGVECEHRSGSAQRNLEEFERMLSGKVKEGEEVLRYKGSMSALNTTLRDPNLARVKNITHYRQGDKYHVWPTYDMNTPVIDSLVGVTDVIRSKEFELRSELHAKLLADLGLRVPRMHLMARLEIKGTFTAKRKIRKLLAEKKVSGWDDPRLSTIVALRRRGIQPLAIKEFALRSGMSLTNSTMDIAALLAENRRIIDPMAKHLYFVRDPKELHVAGIGETRVELRLHPKADLGYRRYDVGSGFYIAGDDFAALKAGDEIRLKDFASVRITGKSQAEAEAEKSGKSDGKVVQWVSKENSVRCSVLVPGELVDENENYKEDSLQEVEGYAESYAAKLGEHDIVQFERFGYCILDSKEDMRFIFTSK